MDSDQTKKTIGSRIAIARKAKGINQDELAAAVGVHKQTISRWERGERAPNGEEIVQIVLYLECSADFILGLSDTLTVSE